MGNRKQSCGYRDRIYKRYATLFKGLNSTFDRQKAWQWGRNYKYYLRGWLPQEEQARILDLACGSGKLLFFLKDLTILIFMVLISVLSR